MTSLAARLLPVIGAVALLAACGEPPQPLPTDPPPRFQNPSSAASGAPGASGLPTSSLPPGALPTTGAYPTTGTGAYPTYGTYPTYPAYPNRTPSASASASATRSGPPRAPKCTNGPTGAQVLAVIKGKPGIPANAQLVLKAGPYCSGSWQFTTVGESGSDYDPLQVVTTGKPSALQLVEAGADVCSDHVHHAAPAGIRVWACGS